VKGEKSTTPPQAAGDSRQSRLNIHQAAGDFMSLCCHDAKVCATPRGPAAGPAASGRETRRRSRGKPERVSGQILK
jgi:hypothetical protein